MANPIYVTLKQSPVHQMKTLLTLLLLAVAIATGYSQDPTPVPTPEPGGKLLLIIIPLLVPIVVAIVKFILPLLPKWSLPIIAPALGSLIDWLSSFITGDTANPINGALLGGAGVAVREIYDQLKKKIAGTTTPVAVLALVGALSLTGGCTTLNQPDVPRIARISQEAAEIGTIEVLRYHLDWRPYFVAVAEELKRLEVSPSINIDNLLDIMGRLPVKELKSDTARLSFLGAKLLISAIDMPELNAKAVADLQTLAKAIREGIEDGLEVQPAKP